MLEVYGSGSPGNRSIAEEILVMSGIYGPAIWLRELPKCSEAKDCMCGT